MEDAVAVVLRQWQQLFPGLDLAPVALVGRLGRCAALLQQAADAPLAGAGISRPEYEVLAALRRVGGELTPGRLARETFASGAAVTKRVRQLEERGLVVRRADGRDRRVAHLSLTVRGRELVDRLLPAQVGHEGALLEGLPEERRRQLAEGLGELLVLLEGRLGGLPG
ncbi:MarR family transcriptional regulator [Streptacidiphilus sp. ASG 303]|uniref:MarR family winged helix-turn-helix transcriptional regulator n=1 Tax=Streptacidiphilus sp. ASG 303 TaxID=2896847 RepID=UPI001E59E82D|nr:MarR family transcriptional regulator [Streptacidiphilus sp. ASG 303]MCD0481169.1 MarR family transcriptional regulator [Streptacidiphilus sp. ASG 303]